MDIWAEIGNYFLKYPVQKRVALLLLQKGFQVNDDGKVSIGNIHIPHTQIAAELGIDRRVVDATVLRILKNEKLSKVFKHLQVTAFLQDAAPHMGFGVIVITPDDASQVGFISKIAAMVAKHNLQIRQAIADDPSFTDNPLLTIITERSVPGNLISDLKNIDGVKKITIY